MQYSSKKQRFMVKCCIAAQIKVHIAYILIAGKIWADTSEMYGVVMVWASYLVKYLSEPYEFSIIRKTRLQHNYVFIENLRIIFSLSFLVYEISGMIRDHQWVK